MTYGSYGYLGIIWFPQPNTKVQVHQWLQNHWCAPFQRNELKNNKWKLFTFIFWFGVTEKCDSMTGRDILFTKPIFWIPPFPFHNHRCASWSRLLTTFLEWNAPFHCTFMWIREKHADWSFGLMVFSLK